MRGLASPHHILGAMRCVPVLVGFVVDNSGSARLVLLVTKQLALFSPFPSSGPRCATSWPVWTRRTENAVAHLQASCICSYLFGVRLAEVYLWTLLGDDFRNGFRIPWFDSGYIFGVILR